MSFNYQSLLEEVDTKVLTVYRFIIRMRILYESDGNGMQVQWNYQSQSNDIQSLSWAYKLDEDFYGTSTSATEVVEMMVDGSSWLSGLTADGGSHTLYVALLDHLKAVMYWIPTVMDLLTKVGRRLSLPQVERRTLMPFTFYSQRLNFHRTYRLSFG